MTVALLVAVLLHAAPEAKAASPDLRVISGTPWVISVPANLETQPRTAPPGDAQVVFGAPGQNRCLVGVEVYGPTSADRPKDAAALKTVMTANRKVVAPPSEKTIGGRTFQFVKVKEGQLESIEHRYGLVLKDATVIVSFVTVLDEFDCFDLENSVVPSLRLAEASSAPKR